MADPTSLVSIDLFIHLNSTGSWMEFTNRRSPSG